MADKTVPKTLNYLRALVDKKPYDLYANLVKALDEVPNVADTEIEMDRDRVVRVQSRTLNDSDKVLFIHLVRYTPGDKASTLEVLAEREEDDEQEHEAPVGREYKEDEAFFLVNQHHTIICSHSITTKKAEEYLRVLILNMKDKGNDRHSFTLSPIADMDRVSLIQKHGVKSVQLPCSIYDLSIPKEKKGTLKRWAETIFLEDETKETQIARSDLNIKLEVSLDGNSYAIDESKELIKEIAEEIVEDAEESFTIITSTNERITSSQIKLKKNVRIDRQNRFLNRSSAYYEMKTFFSEMRRDKLLEV